MNHDSYPWGKHRLAGSLGTQSYQCTKFLENIMHKVTDVGKEKKTNLLEEAGKGINLEV